MRKFCVKQNLIRDIYIEVTPNPVIPSLSIELANRRRVKRHYKHPIIPSNAEGSRRTAAGWTSRYVYPINATHLFGCKHNKRSKPTHDRNPSCAWCGYALISRQARNDGDWALLFYIFLAIIYNKRLCLYAHHFDRSAERAERRNPGEPPQSEAAFLVVYR